MFEELIHPLHQWQRLAPPACNILCVNPYHARVAGSPTSLERFFCDVGDDEWGLDEAVDTILQGADRDPGALADKYQLPRALVDQALGVILTSGL
jgi:hypothetical protein